MIFGIDSLGNMNPDKSTLGRMIIKLTCIACSWVLAIVDTNIPRPRAPIKNMKDRPRSSRTLPLTGTLNQKTPNPKTIKISIKAIIIYGINLPRISSDGFTGVIISCSRVPRSLSRTMENAVSIIVMFCIIKPMRPGILNFILSIFGLYQILNLRSMAGSKFTGKPACRRVFTFKPKASFWATT